MAAAEGGPKPLKGQQREASAPSAHVWLSASAGTGKTQVLTARVLRLLLAGVDPSTILCITFTKAGAAEMQERISGQLARWVHLDKYKLGYELEAIGEGGDEAKGERARTLFAEVLDARGGLRIQTIHSFCQSLLGSFSLEAGLVPGFRPLDGREEADLTREVLAALLVQAEAEGEEALIAAIGRLSVRMGEQAAARYLLECARAGEMMLALPGSRESLFAAVRRELGIPEGDIETAICQECTGFPTDALERLAAANRSWGTSTGLGHLERLERFLAGDAQARALGLAELLGIACTAKGEPRKVPAKLAAIEPDYEALAAALGERCADLLRLRAQAAYAEDLAGGLWAGRHYAAAYAEAKRAQGVVDFDDLIRHTLRLLATPGMGDWVRYKLDQTTDHILVDESQDTNADQWAIVGRLTEEFFAGQSKATPRLRTLFTVGDYKQAIFGFQGTDPTEYARAREHFAQAAEAAEQPFESLSLTHSFRSTRPVLEFVDQVAEIVGAEALGEGRLQRHASEVRGPGTVALWAPVGDNDLTDPGEEGWLPDATVELANRIAGQVDRWLRDGLMLESKGRPLAPGDVMILVRKRGELASLLVARLHARGVPVAGIDRLRLNAPLAVQDLLAAIRFVLQPFDDLNLAALLVSPLIGWSQDELYARGRRASGVPLWPHLIATAAPEWLEPLRAMLARADFVTPYRFLEEILSGPIGGRRRLLARLGEEARDPIEELLSAALQFEVADTPSLQGFMAWFDRGDVEIVRDPGGPVEAVRVMTVHGAKGLQAPLVILADATGDPERSRTDTFDWAAFGTRVPVFAQRQDERGGSIAEAQAAEQARERAEHWRLLYVAMTRAEERLVLAGALGRGRSEAPGESWWACADQAMAGLSHEAGEEGGGQARLFQGTVRQAPVKPGKRDVAAAPPPVQLPDWVHRPAPAEAVPPRPLSPSSIGIDEVSGPPPGPAAQVAAERGRMIHALLQRLPGLPFEARRNQGLRWLLRRGVLGQEAEALLSLIAAIIDDPAHAALFAAGGLAEAPIVAVLDNGMVVSGVVDRLIVAADRVAVVDYKTGRVPAGPDDIPPYHLRQMAAYTAALGVIFPDRRIEAHLLYTAAPVLFTLTSATLAPHKPGYAGAEQSLSPLA